MAQAATPEKMDAGDVAALRIAAMFALALAGAMVACSSVPTAGFWYQDAPLTLSADARDRLGGALTSAEVESIRQLSRSEVERAWPILRAKFGDQP